ncbi:MAG: hypothetical protein H6765_06030 [Candidatus Peribacteria bacterium]|nr:MAG: hypothetical protein H6765_06030 [Candidatus Peribacteria bacterium]
MRDRREERAAHGISEDMDEQDAIQQLLYQQEYWELFDTYELAGDDL